MVLREAPAIVAAPLPDQINPMFPMRLRRKLERVQRRRDIAKQLAPAFGFAVLVIIVVALLVYP